jgi:hypothetical protein
MTGGVSIFSTRRDVPIDYHTLTCFLYCMLIDYSYTLQNNIALDDF